jgi:hypothetical protein
VKASPVGIFWGLLSRWIARLRFPYLLAITAVLFVADLIVPDVIPAIDEILLGLAAALFATWTEKKKEQREGSPPRDGGGAE